MKVSSLWTGWTRKLAAGARKAPRTRRAGAETMEPRQMLSVSALFLPATGELSIEMDTTDSVRILANNGNLLVQGSTNGGPFQQINTVGTVPAANVLSIDVLGGDDSNTIDLSGVTGVSFTSLASIVVDGANGHDLLIGSPDLADNLIGGNGDDTIQSQGGNDTVAGGDGADSITAGVGDDSISAGDGDDTVTGDDGNDTISAGNGQDTISGGNGNDSVEGFNGQDSLLGDAGDDTLNGDGGTDTVDGGIGNDLIFGGEFADSLLGNDGNDTINGQGGADFIFGNNGNDVVSGDGSNDQVDGGAGNDTLNGGVGNDSITGGDDEDLVQGGAGLDSLNGGAGNDRVLGQGGNDTLTGGGGADVLDGGDGVDLVQSGDQLQFAPIEIAINDVSSGLETDSAQFLFNAVRDLNYGTPNGTGSDVDVGDLNGDGLPDIVTLLDQNVSVSLNLGGGLFSVGVLYPSDNALPDKLILADMDGDGDLDVTTTPRLSRNGNPVGTILFNDGNGVLGAEVQIGTGFFFGALGHDVGDVNGDGTPDLVYVTALNELLVPFLNNGTGTFTQGLTTTVSNGSMADVVLGDWDGDGDLDAAVVDQQLDQIVILNNSGTGLFTVVANLPITGATPFGINPEHVVKGDWDLDGDLDLAVNTGNDSALVIFTNSGSGSFVQSQRLVAPGGIFGDAFTTGDFDGDGDLDLAAFPNAFNAEVTVFVNNAGTFGAAVNFTTTPAFAIGFANGTRAADLDGDGAVDLVAADFGNGDILLNSPSRAPVINFAVTLSQASSVPVTVDFQTVNGTAVAGLDYIGTSGTLTFAPGEVTKVIPVRVIGDDIAESNETFYVNLTNAVGLTISDRQGQGLINDDDGGLAAPTLAISDAVLATEGNGITNLNFTVTLAGNVVNPVTVQFETGDLTALAGADYTTTSGTLTFAVGQTTATISVPVLGDAILEPDETFLVNLLSPNGATLLDSRGVGTIRNDDSLIQLVNDTLFGGEGDDVLVGSIGDDIFNGQGGNDSILGGTGNDSLAGGAGKDTLDGQAGDDTLDGQGGDDSLIGGDGNDTFVLGNVAGGDDFVEGGAGFNQIVLNATGNADALNVGQSSGRIRLTRGLATITADNNMSVQGVTVNALGGDDTVTIQDLSAIECPLLLVVNGGEGNDFITAQGSNIGVLRVALNGDNGKDTIIGSNGSDSINGGTGNDQINGQAGNDAITGAQGDDTLAGGLGNDTVDGGNGSDFITGQAGDDSMIGGDGNDTLRGFEGNDTLLGVVGDDLLNGMDGDDSILGGVGQDQITGGSGNDSLDGGRNDDTINGNAGNDFIRGDHGHDYINAGTDSDTVSGGDGNDTIIASDSADLLAGNDGNDQINAGGGDDTILGGDGNDTLLGGGGSDVLLGGDGDDYINGQSGTDIIAGNQGVDIIADPTSEIDEHFTVSAAIMALLDG